MVGLSARFENVGMRLSARHCLEIQYTCQQVRPVKLAIPTEAYTKHKTSGLDVIPASSHFNAFICLCDK